MKEPDHQWLDVINKIDNLGEDYRQNLQVADSIRRERYYSFIRDECKNHERKYIEKQIRKLKERQMVDRAVEEDQRKMQQRLQNQMEYEKQFGDDNRLLFKHRRHKTQEPPTPQHPFIKLVDEQERRNALIRNNFRKQNEINQLQEFIKKEQHNRQRQREQEIRKNYEKYVQGTFKKREIQNCQNRLKYSWNKRSILQGSEDPESQEKRLHKQYLESLQEQIETNRKKRSRTDNSMTKFEEEVNHSPQMIKNSASPAFLGKIPYSHDRKRQLQIINKKLGLNQIQLQNQTKEKIRQLSHLPKIDRFKELRNIMKARDSFAKQHPQQKPAEAKILEHMNNVDVPLKNNETSSKVQKSKPVLNIETRSSNITPMPQVSAIISHPKSIRSFKKYDLLSGQYSTLNILI